MTGCLATFFSVLALLLSSSLDTLAKWFLVKSAMSMEVSVMIEASRFLVNNNSLSCEEQVKMELLNIKDLQNIDAIVSLAMCFGEEISLNFSLLLKL